MTVMRFERSTGNYSVMRRKIARNHVHNIIIIIIIIIIAEIVHKVQNKNIQNYKKKFKKTLS